ncbi:hypothetical protein K4F52_002199 [Lecanicillium sp. MT-2017a]|nr:hypothetical protein K4F52_002199 [Lecanicillium sp. MT-2017a]
MNTPQRVRPGQLRDIWSLCVRQVHGGKRKSPSIGFQGPEGHGEKIWVFAHRRTDQIIYSFKERLEAHHSLKQLPFNGKKTKPAKLRKDYWSPLATIEFPAGAGAVGRTAFQKLRELKHLHEVAWGDEFLYKTEREYTAEDRKKVDAARAKGNTTYRPMRSKAERGVALNAQKANSIADMAAVLAGSGKGNKVAVDVAAKDGAAADVAEEEQQQQQPAVAAAQLVPVTVSWANDQDKGYAEAWSKNVTHSLLPEVTYATGEVEAAVKEQPAAGTDAEKVAA